MTSFLPDVPLFVNLFHAILWCYRVSAEENYLTEAFVFLLRLLLKRQPSSGLDLLNRLCGLAADALFSDSPAITVLTQQTLTVGRPDIEIRESDPVVVYVEVKHDSPIGEGQLVDRFTGRGEFDSDSQDLRMVARPGRTCALEDLTQALAI